MASLQNDMQQVHSQRPLGSGKQICTPSRSQSMDYGKKHFGVKDETDKDNLSRSHWHQKTPHQAK